MWFGEPIRRATTTISMSTSYVVRIAATSTERTDRTSGSADARPVEEEPPDFATDLRVTVRYLDGTMPGSGALEIAKITSRGQITIPKAIRLKMAVQSGDRLAFEVDNDGVLHAFPIRSAEKPLRGFLAERATGVPIDSRRIDEGIHRRTAEKFRPR